MGQFRKNCSFSFDNSFERTDKEEKNLFFISKYLTKIFISWRQADKSLKMIIKTIKPLVMVARFWAQ